MSVCITAVSVVPYQQLAQSKGALVDVVTTAAPGFPPGIFAAIAIFAVANTALLNYVMGSRLLYGMARQGLLPRVLGTVHPKRRTPHIAIGVLLIVVLTLAAAGNIAPLAKATALLLLIAFAVVNTALVLLKNRPGEPRGAFEVPIIIPILGALVCLTLIGYRIADIRADHIPLLITGAIILLATMLFFIQRPKNITEETLAHVEHGE